MTKKQMKKILKIIHDQYVCIEGDFYELSNGNKIRVYSLCDDPDYEYGYDYFDGGTKKLIDGGVFNLDASSSEEVLEEAMAWCDLDPQKVSYSLIAEDVNYDSLEEEGYSGF